VLSDSADPCDAVVGAADGHALDRVVACHLLAGDCDFLLRVVAAEVDAYRRFQIEHVTRIKGVQRVKTEIPMQKIKLSTELPL
jgi:Lrp/AsnC family leucine-responsive transcriptional regulator